MRVVRNGARDVPKENTTLEFARRTLLPACIGFSGSVVHISRLLDGKVLTHITQCEPKTTTDPPALMPTTTRNKRKRNTVAKKQVYTCKDRPEKGWGEGGHG